MLQVNESNRTIHAEGEVGNMSEGFTRNQLFDSLALLSDSKDPIVLHLQSPGGDVFSGQSMFNLLAAFEGHTTVIIDSLAASIATVLMCGADEILANENASIMIHNPFTLMIGDAREFRHTADVLDKLAMDAAEIYSEKSGKPYEEWLEIMNAETWFSAREALDIGLIDGILERSGKKPKAQNVQVVTGAKQSVTVKPAPGVMAAFANVRYRRAKVDLINNPK